jgi:N-acetylglucosamine-6-phosphate deacetylase
MIDLHVHGAAGYDTMDATPEALGAMARFFARHGVTGYLATTIAAGPDHIMAAVDNVRAAPQPSDGARCLGAHIEGPYLNPTQRGAQPMDNLRLPDQQEVERWLATGVVRLITLAPELEGALTLVERCAAGGVETAVGHSSASYDQVMEAAECGLRQVTHIFNGMPPLHHRSPGIIGAALTDERIYAQVIADGVHLHPAVIRLLVRTKGTDRLLLISDSIRAAGLSDGDYDLGGRTVHVRGGVARTTEGSLAGSTITLDAAMRNLIAFTGVSLREGLRTATTAPAEAMGWIGLKGVLAPGADADVILLDRDLHVRLTMVSGEVVYRSDSSARS